MSRQGFEMIRGRAKKFIDISEPVPDQTKRANTAEIDSQKEMDPLTNMRYRALTNARETLLGLIEQDVEDLSREEEIQIANLVEKQTEIVEQLRIKWNAAIGNDNHADTSTGAKSHETSGQGVRKSKRKTAGTRKRSSSPECSPSSNRRSSRSKKSKKYTPPPPSPSMAFPASAPTTLPAESRSRKDLTAEEIKEKTVIHPSFDESTGKKIDKHSRRINCTSGKGMVAGMISNAGEGQRMALEERIRVPSDSPELDLTGTWS